MNTNQTTPVGRVTPCAPSNASEPTSGARGATRPTPFLRAPRTWLVTAALLATVAGVFVARTAFAKTVFNTIDPVGLVTDKGRGVEVTGPLAVTAGERVALRLTVTQRTTGAVAEGETSFTGTGTTNQWQVHTTTLGKAAFAPGPATAVAIAVSTTPQGGVATDAHQWLVNITLVSE